MATPTASCCPGVASSLIHWILRTPLPELEDPFSHLAPFQARFLCSDPIHLTVLKGAIGGLSSPLGMGIALPGSDSSFNTDSNGI